MSSFSIKAGTIIDDFIRVDEVIGRGGMGLVYRATQLMLERQMALKVLDPGIISDKQFRSRFKREAQALSRLSHRHIVGFYNFGFWQETIPYIAMELLQGESLDHLLAKKEPLPAERIKKIAMQVAEALSYVHENGIIHRDLKPSNIMLIAEPDADTVKLLDFGLARIDPKSVPGADKLTRTGSLLGTVLYMSPEQSRGEKIDERADVYSLGCIIYEMLSANPPFDAENAVGIMLKHQNETVPMISSEILSKGLEYEQLACIAEKCLAKKVGQRYQNMKAVLNDLRNLGGEIEAPALRTKSPPSRAVKTALVTGGVAALVTVGFVVANIDACRSSIEAQYLRFAGAKDSWRFALNDAREMHARKKQQEAVTLLIAVLNSAQKNNADIFDLAKIKLELAGIFLEMDQKSEAGIYASQAIVDFAAVSKARSDWVILDAQGFGSDVNKAVEILLQTKHKDVAIADAVKTLATTFEQHKEYECLIILTRLELQFAWQVARTQNAQNALAKQAELARVYYDAKMYSEAKNEFWKNINKAIHLDCPHVVAESLKNLIRILDEKERQEQREKMLAAATQVQKLFAASEPGQHFMHRFFYYSDMGLFYSFLGEKAQAKDLLGKLRRY